MTLCFAIGGVYFILLAYMTFGVEYDIVNPKVVGPAKTPFLVPGGASEEGADGQLNRPHDLKVRRRARKPRDQPASFNKQSNNGRRRSNFIEPWSQVLISKMKLAGKVLSRS
jgi:hypothetical protein